jgi:hypothetical protein
MIRHIHWFAVLFSTLALCACNGTPIDKTLADAPTVTVNATTGQASVAAQPAIAGLFGSLGADFGPDIAVAYNDATNAQPVDTLGQAFFGDLIQLEAAMKPVAPPAGTQPIVLGSLHIFTDLETLRLGLAKAGLTPLKTKTLADGIAWINDTKQKGLAIPGAIMSVMTALMGSLA